MTGQHNREILWGRLADQRPWREMYWLSLMPGTHVTELGSPRTHPDREDIGWVPRDFRRPVKRFVEAGAFAWQRHLGDMDDLEITETTWVASLELCSLVTWQMGRLAREHGLRQAVITWENEASQPLYRIPPYSMATRSALQADLMVCPIEMAREHLAVWGFPEERIEVVPPGVDTDIFTPLPRRDADSQRPTIVFSSPLAPNKGVDSVLAAFALVRRSVPEARLVFAGRGPMLDLVRSAERETSGAVRHAGQLGRHEIAALLATSDVFVTAPRPTWKWNEQFGLAYIEAMACGIPVVTTECGSNDEAVALPNLRVADTPGALAEALLHFLANPRLAREAGAANRVRALERHSLPVMAAGLDRAFTKAEERPARHHGRRWRHTV